MTKGLRFPDRMRAAGAPVAGPVTGAVTGSVSGSVLRGMLRRLYTGLLGTEAMILLPALTLAAYWLGGERALTALAITLPLLLLAARALHPALGSAGRNGLVPLSTLTAALDRVLDAVVESGRTTACLVLRLDGAEALLASRGRAAQAAILARVGERLCEALRQGDRVSRLDTGDFVIALGAVNRLELDSALNLATRLQQAITLPIALEGDRLYLTGSIGFCLAAQMPQPRSGRRLMEAAQIAAEEAARHGPAAVRAFALDMVHSRADRDAYRAELKTALEEGQIRAWFQPQICTRTGAVTGCEALVRWQHPLRGLVPPAEFLPAVEAAGLSERLAEIMLSHALMALSGWDSAGLDVPRVAVNFSAGELRNPHLAERIRQELARFDLTPGRLSVEVLETVMAEGEDDVIARNIGALAAMGCGIDLDDFGTGPSAISNLRRFRVHRIKIDRSFVTRMDEDRSQQTMVAAILAMAERLGIEVLAEGVETPGEHALLAQLGCQHVQGFGIARPMPPEDARDWIARHRSRLNPIRRAVMQL